MGGFRIALGRRLQELRRNAKLTQERLARKAGIEYKYLADIEHARKSPSLDVLERLMRALDIEPCELFSFDVGPRRNGDRSIEQRMEVALRHTDAPTRRLVSTIVRGILKLHGGESP